MFADALHHAMIGVRIVRIQMILLRSLRGFQHEPVSTLHDNAISQRETYKTVSLITDSISYTCSETYMIHLFFFQI